LEEYDLNEHTHRFAVWAASRAASVKGCRFSVAKGKAWIEAVEGLKECICQPKKLSDIDDFDGTHRQWREDIIRVSRRPIKHGIAAKLINIYLKVAIIQHGSADPEIVKMIHPPIDRILLGELRRSRPDIWRNQNVTWSTFSSDEYENVIKKIRKTLGNNCALWKIEEFWRGYQ
jgi:hypothetical protein